MKRTQIFLNRKKSPCLGCENRHVGCHSECEVYLEYRREADIERDRRYEAQKVLFVSTDRQNYFRDRKWGSRDV